MDTLPRLFVIGDSISVQYGPYLEQSVRGVFAYARRGGEEELAKINLDVPQGANRGDSAMVLAYVQARLKQAPFDADVLILNCGLHDLKTDPATGSKLIPIDQYRENLKSIIGLLKGQPLLLAWVRSVPIDEKIHNAICTSFHRYEADAAVYQAVADAVMAAAGVPSIDLHTFTANLGPDLLCDHAHFIDPVRRQQAAFIAGWLMARFGTK